MGKVAEVDDVLPVVPEVAYRVAAVNVHVGLVAGHPQILLGGADRVGQVRTVGVGPGDVVCGVVEDICGLRCGETGRSLSVTQIPLDVAPVPVQQVVGAVRAGPGSRDPAACKESGVLLGIADSAVDGGCDHELGAAIEGLGLATDRGSRCGHVQHDPVVLDGASDGIARGGRRVRGQVGWVQQPGGQLASGAGGR